MDNKTASTQLKELIIRWFSFDELQDLCFDINVEFDELPNVQGERAKNVQALIKILHRQDRLPELVKLCREKRPHVDWPDTSTVLYLEEDLQAIQKYKAAIQEETQHDNLFDFTLDELYIPLKGQEPVEERPKEARPNSPAINDLQAESSSDQTEADAPGQPRRDEKESESPSVSRQPLPLELQEAAEKHPRLIVLGTAGTGKSTFLRHLAHQKAKDNNNVIPIQVNLSKFADERKQNSKAGFEEWTVNAATLSNQAQHDVLIEEIEAGHILWLLDGFDEAIQKIDDPEGFTNLIARSMEGQQFVLTTRPDNIVIKRLSRFKDATQYEMRDLSQHDVEQFLLKWFNNQDKTSEVLEWLTADPHRQRLTAKPLHLVLLATTTKKTKREEWPETRVQLYGKFIHDYVDKRIDKQTNEKGVDEFKELGEELTGTKAHNAILHGFYYLGWVLFQQQNGLYIYEKKGLPESKPPTIKEQVSIYLQNGKGYSNDTAARIFSFWQRSGTQETFQQETDEQEANVQKSFHQTFWAYAAACKLYDDWQKDAENTWRFLSSTTRDLPYASRLHHPAWQEPILMLAALMDKGQLNNLIDRLLRKRDKEERYLHQNLRLAAAILGEIETGKIDEEYEQRIIKKLGGLTRNYPKAHQAVKEVSHRSYLGVLLFELFLLSQWPLLMKFEWFPILQFAIVSILVVRRVGLFLGAILYRHHDLDAGFARYALGALGILSLELLILYKGLPLLPFVISIILWVIFRFIEYPGMRGDSIWSPLATRMRFDDCMESMYMPVFIVTPIVKTTK